MRCRVPWRVIWVYTVCICPKNGTLGLFGLMHTSLIDDLMEQKLCKTKVVFLQVPWFLPRVWPARKCNFLTHLWLVSNKMNFGKQWRPRSDAVKCAASWQNQQNGMCAQWRLRSAWASAQSNQSLRCALNGRTQAFFMRTAKTLIRLGGCWSESSLGAHAILFVLSWGGSNMASDQDLQC